MAHPLARWQGEEDGYYNKLAARLHDVKTARLHVETYDEGLKREYGKNGIIPLDVFSAIVRPMRNNHIRKLCERLEERPKVREALEKKLI